MVSRIYEGLRSKYSVIITVHRIYEGLRSKYSVIITVRRIYESLRSKYSVIITVSLFSHLFLRLFFKLCDYNFFVKYMLNVYSIWKLGQENQALRHFLS